MKRHYRNNIDEGPGLDDPTLDISSLIDVCFLLLIYFLVTTTIQPREQDLSTYVPSAGASSPILLQPMVIEVTKAGEVIVNPGDTAECYDVDVSQRKLTQLEGRLKMLVGWGAVSTPKVILKVHDEVQQQRYIDVVNCLAGVGIKGVALMD